jgi:ABC-type antimicrobial peptide transport system permease subunit
MSFILRQGMTIALVGTFIGLIGALSLSWLLSKLLFAVTPTDPLAFTVSALLLLLVGATASWIPSLRAARIDPMRVLRQE